LAAVQAGEKMPMGANIDFFRAKYLYFDLKSLMTYADGVKPYQITGPDWMQNARFDIVAKMPEGSKKRRRAQNVADASRRAVQADDASHQRRTSGIGPGTGGRPVVDMTGIKGNYDASIDLSLAELIVRLRSSPVLGSSGRITRHSPHKDPIAAYDRGMP
jgi:hypothetical protein